MGKDNSKNSKIRDMFKLGIEFGCGNNNSILIRRLNRLEEAEGVYEIYIVVNGVPTKLSGVITDSIMKSAEQHPIKFPGITSITLFHFSKSPSGPEIGFGEVTVPIDAYFNKNLKHYVLAKPIDMNQMKSIIKKKGTKIECDTFEVFIQIWYIVKNQKIFSFLNK